MKKDFNEFKKYIKGKKVAVLGIGISNTPLIHFLVRLGAKVTAFDRKSAKDLEKENLELKSLGVNTVLGESYLDNLKGYEVIFKTPSMRMDLVQIQKAIEEGAYVTSEMEEFVKYCPAKIYGVTGSDGKTTTTTIISKMLMKEGYKVYVGGNIGKPLFSQIEEIKPSDKVVLELSSFQLMSMDVSTDVAVVTNLSPNHLDIHKDMEEYINAKKNIFKYQDEKGILVLNLDNEVTRTLKPEAKGKVRFFSTKERVKDGAYYEDGILYLYGEKVVLKKDIVIIGMHNVENYLAAFTALYGDVSIESMKAVCESFTGVEHRMEFVREISGVKYYNNAIASSPTRTVAGLKAHDTKVILLAGGYDKHIPFDYLAEEGINYIKVLILMGATKEKIKASFLKVMKERHIDLEIHEAGSQEEAVLIAKKLAKPGDIVTLSPACASFDAFKNFEERGNKFKEFVSSLH